MTPIRKSERGAVTMLIALLVLLSLALIGMTGSRLVMTQHRIAANAARSDAAFAAAEGGAQNAMMYLKPNRSVMVDVHLGGWYDSSSSVKWRPCATSYTAMPCGNGTSNLYGSSWYYYGPVPNQTAIPGPYTVTTWYLSSSLFNNDPGLPSLPCTNLSLSASPPLPSATMTLVSLVNTIVTGLGLLGSSPLQANMCLPINFSQMPWSTWPAEEHPSITIVSSAAPTSDALAGAAVVQQVAALNNLFSNIPPAALMVNGTVSLNGDIRIWGNMRPPTKAPMDFSVLNLNNVLGMNVTSLLNTAVGSAAGAVASSVNVSFAPVLNVTSADVLGFDWDVTFPLSIWSANTTSFSAPTTVTSLGTVLNARTCDPPFPGSASSACTPLSQFVRATPLLGLPQQVTLKLPDIQDPVNVVNTVTGLIGSTVPAFPSDLFDFTFGQTSANASRVQAWATAAGNCSSVTADGFYWVTGDCALAGTIGSATQPVVIVATGNLSFGNNTEVYGVIYLRGSSAHTITGYNSGQRPLIHGAILSEGAVTATNNLSVVYDVNAIRRAGFRSGGFVPMPGGWNDAAVGP